MSSFSVVEREADAAPASRPCSTRCALSIVSWSSRRSSAARLRNRRYASSRSLSSAGSKGLTRYARAPARHARVVEEPDRRAAIAQAIGMAQPGDLVLIAGKGHEDYQIFADRTLHFDDREGAREGISGGV